MSVVRLLWSLTVVLALGGYLGVIRAGEHRIAQERALEASLAVRLDAAERRLRAQPAAARLRDALRQHVRRFALEGDESALVARFVRNAAAIAARDEVRIVAIAADPAPRVDQPATPGAAPSPFAVTSLDLTLEGRYANVLRTARELSQGRVLARVALEEIARTQRDGPGPKVTARLRVQVERLAAEEERHARARHA
jgi:hypothetical protein